MKEVNTMGDVEKILNLMKSFYNNYKNSFISIVVPVLLSLIIYVNFIDKIVFSLPIGKMNIKIDLVYVVIFFIFSFWAFLFFVNRRNLKNRTSLPGIGILIQESQLDDGGLARKKFISRLKRKLYLDFNVIIYNYVDYKKYIENKKLKQSIFKDRKLTFAMIIIEETGEQDGKVYRIDKQNFGFYSNQVLINEFDIDTLQKTIENELNNLIREDYVIHYNNDIEETNEIVEELYLALCYLMTIYYTISNTPDKSISYIESIKEYLKTTNKSSNVIKYIFKNINNREIDAYVNIAALSYQNFLEDECIFLCKKTLKLIERVEEIISGNKSEYCQIISFGLFQNKLDLFFYLHEYDKVIKLIDSLKVVDGADEFIFILKFSSMVCSNNYKKLDSLIFFKKGRKRFNGRQKERMLRYVRRYYENNEYNLNIKFIYCILNRYYKDKTLAERLKEEIIDASNDYYDVLW